MPRAHRVRQVVFYMPNAAALLVNGTPEAAGGAENQVLLLARELSRRGHSVGIVSFDHPRGLRRQIDGVDVIAHPLPSTSVPIVRTLVSYWTLISTLLRNPAAVFVQRGAGIYTPLVALTAILGRRRFVYATAGMLDFDFAPWESRRWVERVFRIGVRAADEVVVQTREQAQACRDHFGREPVLIESFAEPAEKRSARAESFLWVGRLASYKRPLAYVELAKAVPEARFQMVPFDDGEPESAGLMAELERAALALDNLEILAPRAPA